MTRRKKLFIVVVALLVIGAGLYWRQPLANATMKIVYGLSVQNGLIGYWNFDECDTCTTAADKSGNGNTGAITDANASGLKNRVGGKINQALNFDGVDDYVISANNTGISGDATFTMSAWFKTDSLSDIQTVVFTGDSNSSLAAASLVINIGGNGEISAEFANSNSARSAAGVISSTNEWHHFAVVKTPGAINTTTTLYFDGKVIPPSASSANTPNITNAQARIGTFGVSGYYFNGTIDEPRIYNRALSAGEVRHLAEQRGDNTIRSSNKNGLVGYWNFDECDSCTTAADKTGNGSTGTFAGAATRTNGKRGQGLSLSGAAGTRVTVPSTASSITDLTGPMSVSFWFYPQSDVGVIISKQKNLKNYPWEVLTHPTANDIRIGTDDGTNGTLNTATGALTGKQNQWHHGVLIVNGTARQFYLDNALIIDVTSAQSNLRSTDDAIWFGDRSGNADLPWNGLLDEVRIYNRALTADEVARLYEEESFRTTINANQNESFNNGLVGIWSFNGPDVDWSSTTAEILDRSGNELNGDAVSLTNRDARAGMVGQAMNFDGVDDYVDLGTTNIPSGTSPRTIALWMYQRSNTAQNALVALETATGNSFTLIPALLGAYYIFTDSVSMSFTVSAANYPPLNSWNHFVISWDSTTFRYYLNGTLRSSEAYSEATGPLSTVRIGRRAQGASGYFDGLLDEVRIYNRALNAAEIQELYLSSARR